MSGANNANFRASIIVAEHRLGPTPAGHTCLVVDTGRGVSCPLFVGHPKVENVPALSLP